MLRKPAEVRSISTSEAFKRLNAGDLIYPYLVGLFEGDGWFTISKKGKYLLYELGIELSIRDIQLIHNIKNILGVGIIGFRERDGVKMVYLRIRNKAHLINYVLPIFDKYPMFSNKQYDYIRFKEHLISNLIYSKDLPNYIRSDIPINSIDFIINSPYFSPWLVGFIEAEGCFSKYKMTINNFDILSFDISQTNGEIILSAIAKYLSFTTKICEDKTGCYRLKVTSVRSIENIIRFMENAPVKLLGFKKLQYILWIKHLRTIPRYNSKINLCSKY